MTTNSPSTEAFIQQLMKSGADEAFAQGVASELGLMKSADEILLENNLLKKANLLLKEAHQPLLSNYSALENLVQDQAFDAIEGFTKGAMELGKDAAWVEGFIKEAAKNLSMFKSLAAAAKPVEQMFGGAPIRSMAPPMQPSQIIRGNGAPIMRSSPLPKPPMTSPAPIQAEPGAVPPQQNFFGKLKQWMTGAPPGQAASQATANGLAKQPLLNGPGLPKGIANKPTGVGANGAVPTPAPVPTGPQPPQGFMRNMNPFSLPGSARPSLLNDPAGYMGSVISKGMPGWGYSTPGRALASAATAPLRNMFSLRGGMAAAGTAGALGEGASYMLNGGHLNPMHSWDGGDAPDESGEAGDRNQAVPGLSNQFLGGAGGAMLLPMLAKGTPLEGIPAPLLMMMGGYGGYKLLPYLMNHMNDPRGFGVNKDPYQNALNNHFQNPQQQQQEEAPMHLRMPYEMPGAMTAGA